jgi:hypothetical protein
MYSLLTKAVGAGNMRSISDVVDNLLKRVSLRRRRASERRHCECPLMFAEILAASTFPEFTDTPLELWRRKQDLQITNDVSAIDSSRRQNSEAVLGPTTSLPQQFKP